MTKVAILGFGEEGKSVLRFLKKDPRYKNASIRVLDKKLDKGYLKNLTRFNLIFRSPGVPYNLPELKRARKKGVRFSSATKLFFEEAEKRGVKTVGITGSKGKTTTATLLYKMLKAGGPPARAGKRVFLAGNIGKSPLDLLPKLKKNDWVVLELSSFQLQDLERSPQIAVLLELFPEHLDIKSGHGGHANLKEYYSAKANLVRHQNKNDAVFYFAHNPMTVKLAKLSPAKKVAVSEKTFRPFRQEDLKLKGLHMFRNALAAAAVAKHLGVPERTIRKTATAFRGVPHRLELVRRIGKIEFYNDSIATSPEAAAAAIKSFPGRNIILLAGGFDKNLNYIPLAKALTGSGVRLVILYGQNRKKIARAIKRQGTRDKRRVILVNNLKRAVQRAYKFVSALVARRMSPVAILLSPGAASFDQFASYADRGNKFKALVKNL